MEAPLRKLIRSSLHLCILQNMSPHNNAALMTRSLQMRNSLLTAAGAANPSAAAVTSPSALLASQAAAAAMFNHQASAASLFAAANIKSNSAAAAAVAGVAEQPQIDFSLPITSTYLRRMRALGLAQAQAASQQQGFAAHTVVSANVPIVKRFPAL